MFLVRILHFRQFHLGGKQMIGAKSRIECAQREKTVDEQTGADQENKRDRHFGDNKQTPYAIAAHAWPGIAAAFLERFIQIETRRLGGGSETKNQAGRKRQK